MWVETSCNVSVVKRIPIAIAGIKGSRELTSTTGTVVAGDRENNNTDLATASCAYTGKPERVWRGLTAFKWGYIWASQISLITSDGVIVIPRKLAGDKLKLGGNNYREQVAKVHTEHE